MNDVKTLRLIVGTLTVVLGATINLSISLMNKVKEFEQIEKINEFGTDAMKTFIAELYDPENPAHAEAAETFNYDMRFLHIFV